MTSTMARKAVTGPNFSREGELLRQSVSPEIARLKRSVTGKLIITTLAGTFVIKPRSKGAAKASAPKRSKAAKRK